jgi:hypothetical protein
VIVLIDIEHSRCLKRTKHLPSSFQQALEQGAQAQADTWSPTNAKVQAARVPARSHETVSQAEP